MSTSPTLGTTALQVRREVLRPVQGPDVTVALQRVFGAARIAVVDTEFMPERVFEIAISHFGPQPCVAEPAHDVLARLRPQGSGGAPLCAVCWGFGFPQAWLVDPQVPLTFRAKEASHVTDRDVLGAGTFAAHAPRLMRHLSGADYLIGWNIGNDKNRLERELREAGLSHGPMHWVDLAAMFQILHPHVGTSPVRKCKLGEAAAFYGFVPDPLDEHYAFFDVLTTAFVLGEVCAEWGASDLSLRQIAVSGWTGPGWDPRALDAPVARVKMRFPSGRPEVAALAAELETAYLLQAR